MRLQGHSPPQAGYAREFLTKALAGTVRRKKPMLVLLTLDLKHTHMSADAVERMYSVTVFYRSAISKASPGIGWRGSC